MKQILEAHNVSVSFGGLQAVMGMYVEVLRGEIVGIIGPNGAGKSTFFNAISGHQGIDSGRITFLGTDVTTMPAYLRARMGMARTFQLGGLIDDLTAIENVVLGLDHYERTEGKALKSKPVEALALLQKFELEALAGEIVGSLPTGTKRQIEVARAIAAGAQLILLDEPGASLSAHEQERLVRMIRGLANEGKSFLLTDHTTDFVFPVCDRITVMNFGEPLAHGTPEEIRKEEKVLEAYLGKGA